MRVLTHVVDDWHDEMTTKHVLQPAFIARSELRRMDRPLTQACYSCARACGLFVFVSACVRGHSGGGADADRRTGEEARRGGSGDDEVAGDVCGT